MKVIALYEMPPKQFEPDPNPQKAYFLAPKSQKSQNCVKAAIAINKSSLLDLKKL